MRFLHVLPCRLERLELGSCGRGFGDAQASILAGSGPLPAMTGLVLGGAYRLSDDGLEKVIGQAYGAEDYQIFSG